jgi:hypothetical protein
MQSKKYKADGKTFTAGFCIQRIVMLFFFFRVLLRLLYDFGGHCAGSSSYRSKVSLNEPLPATSNAGRCIFRHLAHGDFGLNCCMPSFGFMPSILPRLL